MFSLQEKALDVTDLGSAVKLETKQPHFVSLGGGRLSVGVSIIPIQKGEYNSESAINVFACYSKQHC